MSDPATPSSHPTPAASASVAPTGEPATPTPLSDPQTVKLTVDADGAATIELHRPDALNAWNTQLGLDLLAAVRAAADDPAVRAVVITGAGRAFSSGADLKDFSGGVSTPNGRPDVYKTLTERYHPIMHAIREMPKPVIAAVNGPAVGIGCSLALCCDLIVAAERAYFLLAFVNIGLVPDGGSSLFVPTRIGMARASEMAMLGERIPAAQALDWGLINRVVPDNELRTHVAALAARLAAGPTRSYAGTKRQLNQWLYANMASQLELEAQIQREMAGSDDFVEGALAFVQKRPPRFAGR
ncbi:MAG TPA: enoyl-CoA hydratase [Solirubrobacteraceae bacterium]|nr:enoyl-CoA hydratase [Solirubrobacteraceae bacterium]